VLLIIGKTKAQYQIDSCKFVVGKDTIDFCKIEKGVKNIPKSQARKIEKLSAYLAKISNNDYEKVLAFYTYIGEYIKYDLARAKKAKRKKITRILSARELIRIKRGICGDVSYLFQELCERTGITSRIVLGYSKSKVINIFNLRKKNIDHIWNVVQINGVWYYVDATWGMRLFTDRKMNREFINYSYLFALPESFNKEHLPVDPIWQLTNKPVTWNYFKWGGLAIKKHYYSTNYAYKDSIKQRLKLNKVEEIIASANSALDFIPKNKYVIIQLLNLPAEDYIDKKKQKNKKLTLEEYYATQKLYKTIIKYTKTLDTRKSRAIANYIEKKLKKVEKKIVRLEKRKHKTDAM